uniref:Uncharacterized protein n=1 Tax=Oryza punctata TaxID=4537 RepID=A0A0E0M3E5_ORYPU
MVREIGMKETTSPFRQKDLMLVLIQHRGKKRSNRRSECSGPRWDWDGSEMTVKSYSCRGNDSVA